MAGTYGKLCSAFAEMEIHFQPHFKSTTKIRYFCWGSLYWIIMAISWGSSLKTPMNQSHRGFAKRKENVAPAWGYNFRNISFLGTAFKEFPLDSAIDHLVCGLEYVDSSLFFHIWRRIISIDFQIFQRGRAQPPTRSIDYPYTNHILTTKQFFI